jgi:zinc D-Ala-D-Ala carboxypeptidase
VNHFKISEFDCPCCGANEMSQTLLTLADIGREQSGVPWVINSAYRCEAHNASVRSKSDVHPKGLAIDVSTPNSRTRFRVLQAMIDLGFNRIGMGSNFIHGDIDSTKDINVMWTYGTG